MTEVATTNSQEVKKIIIVEDEIESGNYYQSYISSLFDNQGITVEWLKDLSEEYICQIDIEKKAIGFIVDININGDKNRGIELVTKLREQDIQHPIGVYSGYPSRKQEALEAGVNFFVKKDADKMESDLKDLSYRLMSLNIKQQSPNKSVNPNYESKENTISIVQESPPPQTQVSPPKKEQIVELSTKEATFISKQLLHQGNTESEQDWFVGDSNFEVEYVKNVNTQSATYNIKNYFNADVSYLDDDTLKSLKLQYNGTRHYWNFENQEEILNNFKKLETHFPSGAKTILRIFSAYRLVDFFIENNTFNKENEDIIGKLGRFVPLELFKIIVYKYHEEQLEKEQLSRLISKIQKGTEITFKYLYEARITNINKASDTAFVSMENLIDRNEAAIPKQLSLKQLKKQMINSKHDRFLMLFYEYSTDETNIHIEPLGTPKTFF